MDLRAITRIFKESAYADGEDSAADPVHKIRHPIWFVWVKPCRAQAIVRKGLTQMAPRSSSVEMESTARPAGWRQRLWQGRDTEEPQSSRSRGHALTGRRSDFRYKRVGSPC